MGVSFIYIWSRLVVTCKSSRKKGKTQNQLTKKIILRLKDKSKTLDAFRERFEKIGITQGDWRYQSTRKQPTTSTQTQAEKLKFCKTLKDRREGHKPQTGWKINGKLNGGTPDRKRKIPTEEETPTKKTKIEPRQEIIISYQNVNRLDEIRKQEIEEYMEDFNVDIMICSETKKQQGDLLNDNNIRDYALKEFLRPDMQEGGIVIYTKENLTVVAETWEGLGSPTEQWMDSERLWLLLKTETEKLAICSAYLRCTNYSKPELYTDNCELMNKISESVYLR